jgi:hypothetical protein
VRIDVVPAVTAPMVSWPTPYWNQPMTVPMSKATRGVGRDEEVLGRARVELDDSPAVCQDERIVGRRDGCRAGGAGEGINDLAEYTSGVIEPAAWPSWIKVESIELGLMIAMLILLG